MIIWKKKYILKTIKNRSDTDSVFLKKKKSAAGVESVINV